MKKDILLIGGGGHCASCIDVIEMSGYFNIAGIIDNALDAGVTICGYPVLGNDSALVELKVTRNIRHAMITVGQLKTVAVRMKLFNLLLDIGFTLPVVISPRAHVARMAVIGDGTVVMHDCLINSNVTIGKNCIINTKALVEHDSTIGDFCHISTGAIINGTVVVGARTFVGSGAVVVNNITVEPESFIKAGSLIYNSQREIECPVS
jgi:sugar O-acyltransferase (sialic acid O-acetyltransferase NeuD family)